MIKMKLTDAAAILGISGIDTPLVFQGLSIDTRSLQPHNLFLAIKGANSDGHDFIEEAYNKGASGALVSHKVTSPLAQLLVDDVVIALGKLSAAWRKQFTIPVIAVTGSNGKTTLKNMIASILLAKCRGDESQVLATKGTLNNHLGLPLTLARLDATHRYAVIEMGMNHFGEIKYLTELAHPTVALITNAAHAHLEGVQDLLGVARAKAEIFHGLAKGGTAILNRDDAFYTYWRGQVENHPCLTFGLHPDADISVIRAKEVAGAEGHYQDLELRTPRGPVTVKLPLLGKHNVLNALAAVAATLTVNVDLEHIKKGLDTIQPVSGRLELHNLANGVRIIDDTYNANPFSLSAAVDTLASFTGKKILVLGDMKELGKEAKSMHHMAGKAIREAGIDYLFTYGELSANTAEAFGEGAYHFNEQAKLVNALKPLLCTQTTILVKGSRSMHMEKVIHQLMQS